MGRNVIRAVTEMRETQTCRVFAVPWQAIHFCEYRPAASLKPLRQAQGNLQGGIGSTRLVMTDVAESRLSNYSVCAPMFNRSPPNFRKNAANSDPVSKATGLPVSS